MQGEHIKISQTLNNSEKEISRSEFLNDIIYISISVFIDIIELNTNICISFNCVCISVIEHYIDGAY